MIAVACTAAPTGRFRCGLPLLNNELGCGLFPVARAIVVQNRKPTMIDKITSEGISYSELRAAGVKYSFTNVLGNTVNCYGVSDEEADHYELFVDNEQEGHLENPDKLGWEEVASFLEEQPDDWSEVFGSSQPSEA